MHAALAELKGIASPIPNQVILMEKIVLERCQFFASITTGPRKAGECFILNEQLILLGQLDKTLVVLKVAQISRHFRNGYYIR